jgi:hypothetical protein
VPYSASVNAKMRKAGIYGKPKVIKKAAPKRKATAPKTKKKAAAGAKQPAVKRTRTPNKRDPPPRW